MEVLFFFKQKTAYEMRISDWSSDVLFRSSGVAWAGRRQPQGTGLSSLNQNALAAGTEEHPASACPREYMHSSFRSRAERSERSVGTRACSRSEERRVGKEFVSTFRSRSSPSHLKTNKEYNLISI